MASDEDFEQRLQELYVEQDLSIHEVAAEIGRGHQWTRDQLIAAGLHEPQPSTVLADLDPDELGESVEPPEPNQRRIGGGSA